MSGPSFAEKVDVLKSNRSLVSVTTIRRKDFKGILDNLHINTFGSSLGKAIRELDDVYGEISADKKVKVKTKKGEKETEAWRELRQIIGEAHALSKLEGEIKWYKRKKGKLHKGRNLRKLERLVARTQNLINQLAPEELPSTHGRLKDAQADLANTLMKFASKDYNLDSLKSLPQYRDAELSGLYEDNTKKAEVLSAALKDIKSGATFWSLKKPHKLFRSNERHPETIGSLPTIIDALSSHKPEQGEKASIRAAVHRALKYKKKLGGITDSALKTSIKLQKLKPGTRTMFEMVRDTAKLILRKTPIISRAFGPPRRTAPLHQGTVVAYIEPKKPLLGRISEYVPPLKLLKYIPGVKNLVNPPKEEKVFMQITELMGKTENLGLEVVSSPEGKARKSSLLPDGPPPASVRVSGSTLPADVAGKLDELKKGLGNKLKMTRMDIAYVYEPALPGSGKFKPKDTKVLAWTVTHTLNRAVRKLDKLESRKSGFLKQIAEEPSLVREMSNQMSSFEVKIADASLESVGKMIKGQKGEPEETERERTYRDETEGTSLGPHHSET